MHPSKRFIVLVGCLVCVWAACGDTEDDVRRGGQGASCDTTNDCEAPLTCIQNICGGPQGMGGDGGGQGGSTSSGGGSQGGSSSGGGPIGTGESISVCDDSLDAACEAQHDACDDACLGVEACIETVCHNIPDATEEGQCFVYCQDSNPGGKAPHLALVDCAIASGCAPGECPFFPQSYDECKATMVTDQCASEAASCTGDVNCQAYQDCTSSCNTADDCISCSSTTEGTTGRALLEALNRCVARECLAESWLL